MVTFLSAVAVILDIETPANSISTTRCFLRWSRFRSSFRCFPVCGPCGPGLLDRKNAALIPMLGYATGCMMTLGSVGFFYGVFDRLGFFLYRTPKGGAEKDVTRTKYLRNLTNDSNSMRVEGVLAAFGLLLTIPVALHGIWFLTLSMLGFALFTLKSMNLTRNWRSPYSEKTRPGKCLPEISPRAMD